MQFTFVSRDHVGRRLRFTIRCNEEPEDAMIEDIQNDLGYSPAGYGGPWNILRTKIRDGEWEVRWECADTCD